MVTDNSTEILFLKLTKNPLLIPLHNEFYEFGCLGSSHVH